MERREIAGFTGYWIYEDGRVWSVRSGNFLTAYSGGDTYCQYSLYDNGKRRRRYAHRLVLEAFVGPCPDGMECRHLDGNPQNNHVSNLRWDTHVNNVADRKLHGTECSGERQGSVKLDWNRVHQIRRLLEQGDYTQRKIADMFGVSPALITRIKKREVW